MKIMRKKSMRVFIWGVLMLIGIILVYFNIPISKERAEFKKMVKEMTKEENSFVGEFTQKDIENLPEPVQKYFTYCGFIGKPKMSYMNAVFTDVPFLQGKGGKELSIDYNQYNLVEKPYRIAHIDSSLFGVPFEGIEYIYKYNNARMKGVVAKTFSIFDVTGKEMNQSALVTYLAECLIVPNAALQDFIQWEAIDDLHSKATISYDGVTASGVFTFNEKGEMTSFETDDRWVDKGDGSYEKRKWSALCSEYKNNNGIIQPTHFKAVWHYDDGDLVYFNSDNIKIQFK